MSDKETARNRTLCELCGVDDIEDLSGTEIRYTRQVVDAMFDAGWAARSEASALLTAIEKAAQSKYGSVDGRYLGSWEMGFENGRSETIKQICEELGLDLPTNHKRIRADSGNGGGK